MGDTSYEIILMKRLAYFSIICAIVFVLAILCSIYLIKKMRNEKILFIVLISLCFLVLIGSIILISIVAGQTIYDIRNQAYVTWNGEFIVDTDVETRSGTCSVYIPDKNGVHLETDAYILEAGKYHGTIVYAKKTRVVLDIKTITGCS